MPSILLQAGHSARFFPFMSGGGGAPGEAEWTADLAVRLTARLAAAGVNVVCCGCWALDNSNVPPQVSSQDYDLFVSLHYDAYMPQVGITTGCFAGRATLDPRGLEADAFIGVWEAVYLPATGIALHKERLNPNVTDYYAFRATTANTPGVLIEHGVGQGDDYDLLFNSIDVVADADASALLMYLGLAPEPPEPIPPEEEMTPEQRAILEKMAALNANAGSIDVWLSRLGRTAEIGRTLDGTKRLLHSIDPLIQELMHMAD